MRGDGAPGGGAGLIAIALRTGPKLRVAWFRRSFLREPQDERDGLGFRPRNSPIELGRENDRCECRGL